METSSSESTNDLEQPEITEWEEQQKGDTNFSALMNIVTGAIGSGIVYLPGAAGFSGLGLGLGLIVIMGLVSAHSTTVVGTVLLMARNLCAKSGKKDLAETFEDMASVVWGTIGFWVIAFFNYLDLYLTVAVFMGTLAATVNDLIDQWKNREAIAAWENQPLETRGAMPSSIEFEWLIYGIAAWGVVVLPLCYLKTMDAISKMSCAGVLGNVVILLCILISALGDSTKLNNYIADLVKNANDDEMNAPGDLRERINKLYCPYETNPGDYQSCPYTGRPQYTWFVPEFMWGAYGNFGFSYAVASFIPSLVMGMRKPKSLGRVVWHAHFIITFIYAAVIFISWLAWGNGVCVWGIDMTKHEGERLSFGAGNIINGNFMPNINIQTAATLGLLVSIVSSVPLFFFVIAIMVEDLLKKKWPDVHDLTLRIVNRTMLMIVCLVPVVLLNLEYPTETKLSAFQGFTGAVTTTTTCSILPNCLFFALTRKFEKGHVFRSQGIGYKILCVCCILVGTFTAVVGFLADGLQIFGVDGPFA